MGGFETYFWGLFLIGVGILLVAKYYFKLSISMARIVGGVFFIAFGLSWLLGGFQTYSKSDMFFNEGTIHVVQAQDDYNIVFSNGVIDLTNLPLKDGKTKVEVNVIFGKGTIKINPDITTVVNVNGAFAKAETPDGSSIAFGEHGYRTSGADDNKILYIDGNVVFGQLDVLEIQGDSLQVDEI